MLETKIDFTKINSFELDNHLILLKQNASRVQVLNPLASIIWQFKKSGLSNLQIAKEISVAFDIPFELALQDINSINAQWMLDLANSVEDETPQKKTVPLAIELTDWHVNISAFFCFPGLTVRVNFDSDIVAEKLRQLLANITIPETNVVDVQIDVIPSSGSFLIVKDGLVLDQAKTESSTALLVFRHIVDLACKNDDWIAILHAAGVSWQGHGIVFPAQGGSGKTTLTAALIKQGFDYINDDVIPLLRTGELVHLVTSLSIKSGSWHLLQPLYPELETLEIFGSQEPRVKYLPQPATDNPLPALYAKHIILPNYQPGATAKLEPLPSVLAFQAIIECESLFHLPLNKKDIAALIKWLIPLTCHRLSYDKLDSAVALLHQFCMDNPNS